MKDLFATKIEDGENHVAISIENKHNMPEFYTEKELSQTVEKMIANNEGFESKIYRDALYKLHEEMRSNPNGSYPTAESFEPQAIGENSMPPSWAYESQDPGALKFDKDQFKQLGQEVDLPNGIKAVTRSAFPVPDINGP